MCVLSQSPLVSVHIYEGLKISNLILVRLFHIFKNLVESGGDIGAWLIPFLLY